MSSRHGQPRATYNPDIVKLLFLTVMAAAACAAQDTGRTVTFGKVESGGKAKPLIWDQRGIGLWHIQRDGTLWGSGT